MAVIFNTYRFFGPLPSDIFGFLYIYFYMWTSNIISHTSQCSLLSWCILVCKISKKKKKNAESWRKFPLPRPSCVHSGEKRPDGQWVEISGGPAGLHLLPHIPGSPGRAGLGALSRTRSLNVKTSGSKDPWTNRNWTGSWQRSWGQLLVSCLFEGENASMT